MLPVLWVIPPLDNRILVESKPETGRMLVRKAAASVMRSNRVLPTISQTRLVSSTRVIVFLLSVLVGSVLIGSVLMGLGPRAG